MQRRTLIYTLILALLGVAIVVVVVLILRKRAEGPAIVYIPSASVVGSVRSTTGTQSGDPTEPRSFYKTAPVWKEGDPPAQAIYRPQPLIVPNP